MQLMHSETDLRRMGARVLFAISLLTTTGVCLLANARDAWHVTVSEDWRYMFDDPAILAGIPTDQDPEWHADGPQTSNEAVALLKSHLVSNRTPASLHQWRTFKVALARLLAGNFTLDQQSLDRLSQLLLSRGGSNRQATGDSIGVAFLLARHVDRLTNRLGKPVTLIYEKPTSVLATLAYRLGRARRIGQSFLRRYGKRGRNTFRGRSGVGSRPSRPSGRRRHVGRRTPVVHQ